MAEPNIWIVGKNNGKGQPWEFMGAFDTEVAAVGACADARYFIGPAVLNVMAPIAREEWPDAYYPMVEVRAGSLDKIPAIS